MVVDVLSDLFNLKLYPQQPRLLKVKHCCDQSNTYAKKRIRKHVSEPYAYSQSTFNQSLETCAPIN